MTLVDYKAAYDNNKEVKEYVDKVKRSHATTVEVVLQWKIVQEYIKDKIGGKNGPC